MRNRRNLLLISIALLGVLLLVFFSQRGSGPSGVVVQRGAARASERDTGLEPPPAPESRREEIAREEPQPATLDGEPAAVEDPPFAGIRGYVEDTNGIRQAGCVVYFQPFGPPAGHGDRGPDREDGARAEGIEFLPPTTTDAQGRFTFPPPPADGYLGVDSPGLIGLLLPSVQREDRSNRDQRIIVAFSILVAGTVTEVDGTPIEDAMVRLLLPQGAPGQSGTVQRSVPTYSVRTDAEGRFVLSECPDVEGATLWANHGDYHPQTLDVPPPGAELHFVLEPLEEGRLLCGIVLDAAGLPAEGASVSIGSLVEMTAADGTFCVNAGDRWALWLPADEPIELVAVGADAYSEVVRLPAPGNGLAEAWPEPLLLQLTEPRLDLRGRVVDAEGNPRPGLTVDLVDSTVYGFSESPPGSGSIGRAYREAESGGISSAPTAPDGGFLLTGLEDRPYTVEVVDLRLLTSKVIEGVRPGPEFLEIVFEPDLRRVTGTVVHPDGEPVPDVRLTVTRESTQRGLFLGSWTTTGEDGTFQIGAVQDDDLLLRVEGDQIVPSLGVTIPREELQDARLVVSRRFHVRIDWSTVPQDAVGVGFCDARGERITGVFRSGNRFSIFQTIRARVDAAFILPQEAAFAILLGPDEGEVGRTLLNPTLAEEQVVRF